MTQAMTAVFREVGVPMYAVTKDVPDPGPGELTVRLELAGVCGSESHRILGDLPASGEEVCLGHEGVGRIEALGEGVTTDRAGEPLAVGDRLYWMPIAQCGLCENCLQDMGVAFCAEFRWPLPISEPNAATFQELATLRTVHPYFKVSNTTSPEALIALGCGLPTAIGGFMKLPTVGPDVVVQGSGPLGLASTLLAVRAGARQVIVIGAPAGRLDVATRLGATTVIPLEGTTVEERRARVLELTGGAGAATVIEATGYHMAFPEGLELVGRNGTYLVMGIYSGTKTVEINPVLINNRNLVVRGTLGYPVDALRQTVELAGEVGESLDLASLVTHRFPISRSEEAVRAAYSGEAVKSGIVPEAAAGA